MRWAGQAPQAGLTGQHELSRWQAAQHLTGPGPFKARLAGAPLTQHDGAQVVIVDAQVEGNLPVLQGRTVIMLQLALVNA